MFLPDDQTISKTKLFPQHPKTLLCSFQLCREVQAKAQLCVVHAGGVRAAGSAPTAVRGAQSCSVAPPGRFCNVEITDSIYCKLYGPRISGFMDTLGTQAPMDSAGLCVAIAGERRPERTWQTRPGATRRARPRAPPNRQLPAAPLRLTRSHRQDTAGARPSERREQVCHRLPMDRSWCSAFPVALVHLAITELFFSDPCTRTVLYLQTFNAYIFILTSN